MNPRVLLITGPAGAGKTTVAEEWATSGDERRVHLSLDSFRHMVKTGFIDPKYGWNDEVQVQLDIARANVASVAARYLNTGYQVVVDDALFPNWEAVGLGPWRRVMAPIEVDLVALMPDWEVVLSRDKGRAAHQQIPDEMLRTIYDDMAGWHERSDVAVIDNSVMPVGETVAEIERLTSSWRE
jgi:chloramphenicol 3-O-phosphotransferase